MQRGKFTFIVALVGVAAAAGGLSVAMISRPGDDVAEGPLVLPIIDEGVPDIEILGAGDGRPLEFQDRLRTLNELQRRTLIRAIKDGTFSLDLPIGMAFISDGTVIPFDPDQGPPQLPEGTNQGSVDIFVFPTVPSELRG